MTQQATHVDQPTPAPSACAAEPSSDQNSNMTKVNEMTNTTNVVESNEIVEIIESIEIAKLDGNAKLKEIVEKMNEIIERLNTAKAPKVRDRGPDSQREMTEDDARSILLGELKDKSHKDVAKELGLSYGQIYSSRKGFTFKGVFKEWRDAQPK